MEEKKIGNPAVVGLAGFGLTTMILRKGSMKRRLVSGS